MKCEEFQDILDDFKRKADANTRIGTLLKNWSPYITLEPEDADYRFLIKIRDKKIFAITTQPERHTHEVLIKGNTSVFRQVFTGKMNPAVANANGDLKIFGTGKDEVKLDAISLVLWGI